MNRNSLLYCFLKKCENPPDKLRWRFLNTLFCSAMIIRGYMLYAMLKRKYLNKIFVILPSASAGDLLFFKVLQSDFENYCKIKEPLYFIDERRKEIAESLGYKNIMGMSYQKITALNMARVFFGEKMNLSINAYPWFFFDLSALNNINIQYPVFQTGDLAKELSYNIVRNKTVILSPYEYSATAKGLATPNIEFWEVLTKRLKEKGFCVVTNCKGDDNEPAIKGTRAIFPQISCIHNVVIYAGNIIGMRSGLFDFLAGTAAKKIILYPSEEYLKQWSVFKIWEDAEVREINCLNYISENRLSVLINEIVDYVSGEM